MHTEDYIDRERQYGAHNYHPLPVVLHKGEGIYVWDVDGKQYMDFLSGYSALNQGHRHPKVLQALMDQAGLLTLTSRAFHSDVLGDYMEYACKLFGYDKLIPMNSGAEGVETALKLCRRWAYVRKGTPVNLAKIVVCEDNFHGRTITAVSMSTDPASYDQFGPFTPGFIKIKYNDLDQLAEVLKQEHVAGFLLEPIQGEAGIVVPDEGYLKKAYQLCQENDVLFIADEIQTGLGRTGKMLCCDYEGVHPDVLILGKALSAGVFPISAVLARDEIMLCIKPGEHGSTFGGSPLSARVAKAAIEVVIEEKLAENAFVMGQLFRESLEKIDSPLIDTVRGKGLLNAIVTVPQDGITAWDICIALRDRGLLAKPTHEHIIRFAPPLIINEAQLQEAIHIITEVFASYKAK